MQNAGSKAKSGDKPPKIVSHLKSDFVKDGEPVTLSCRIIGMLNRLDYILPEFWKYKHTYSYFLLLIMRIYKTIILPVILYGCETWSLTLREDIG
jgi:hypothetical protein